MNRMAYDPSPEADKALRLIATLAHTMPDFDSPAACCPLVEDLGGDEVVRELLNNKMIRELAHEDPTDGKRVGMTDTGLQFIDAKIDSNEYEIEIESSEYDWIELDGPQI